MSKQRRMSAMIGRSLLIVLAVLFILFSLAGIGGTWYVNRVLTNITLQIFTVVESGVSLADNGIGMALDKVKESRSEIALTQQDIETLGTNLKANHPGLTALSERLDTRLAPTVENLQTVLAPVKDALVTINSVLAVANEVPFMREQAPGLEDAQEAIENVLDMQADVQQLRTTLRAAAEGKADVLTDQTTAVLLRLAERIDTRLAKTQANLEAVQAKIQELQREIAARKARLLFLFNLGAVLITLAFIWIIYSQIVVIRAQIERWPRSSQTMSSIPDDALPPSSQSESLPASTLQEESAQPEDAP